MRLDRFTRVLAAALLFFGARTFLDTLPAGAASRLPHVVQCDEVIGATPSPRPNERVVLDRVALQRKSFPYPLFYQPEVNDRLPYFSKWGLEVRAGSQPVELIVPSRWRTRLAIGWGNRGSYSAAIVHVTGCPPKATGDWLVYPGGFYLRRPACVRLIVRVGSRRTSVRIAIGKRCPTPRPGVHTSVSVFMGLPVG